MAGASCSFVLKKAHGNGDSTLYKELLNITNNKDIAKRLYAIYGEPDIAREYGFNINGNEPSFVEFLDKTDLVDSILNDVNYPIYINKKEGLDELEYDTWGDAAQKISTLQEQYPQATFIASETGDSFKVSAVVSTEENTIKSREQQALARLNSNLISYMEGLGFAVSSVENLGSAGKFSPLGARKNADNLIEIIKLSKGIKGQEALPEEFSHLIFEGIQGSPISDRILNALKNNMDVVELILGEDYDRYYDEYNGEEDTLAREAAARLIAQNLADRSGISSEVRYVSNRYLDHIANIFKNGEESDIREMLSNLQKEVDKIASDVTGNVVVDGFNIESVLSAKDLYRLDGEVSKAEEIANEAFELFAKRIKIINLRKKNGKFNARDAEAYDKIKTALDKAKYSKSITQFLKYANGDIQNCYERIKELRELMRSDDASTMTMKQSFSRLRTTETLMDAYEPIIERLKSLSEDSDIAEELSEESIESIEEAASEASKVLGRMRTIYKELRFDTLLKFYRQFWGEDKVVNGKTIRLEDVLNSTVGDTNVMGRLINSMSNMPDPLLQLVDIAYKNATDLRNKRVYEIQQRLGIIQRELVRKTGSRDTSFAYVFVDGKPTGMLKSNIDYAKYYKEKHDYYLSLKEQGLDSKKISARLNSWKNSHCRRSSTGEMMPKQELYPSNDYDNLTQAQKEYLDEIMAIKSEMDSLIGGRAYKYRAPQKKISSKEAIITKGNLKGAFKRFKDNFVDSVDDTEFGEELQNENGKYVLLDFSGNEVKKVPVYYTTLLDDMSMLDTNLTDTMLSYAAMAINYDAMSNIAGALEITSSQMQDRDILQTKGQRILREKFRVRKDLISGDYKKPGATSELAKKLRNYIDANIYGRRKEKETIVVGNKEINAGKVADSIVRYNSLVGLGYNLFSGTTNITMGVAQTLIHAVGGKNFGLRDVAKAHVWYNKDLAGAIADQYQDVKKNKLNLLLNKFDALEEFYEDLESSDYYGGVFKKMVGKHSPLIFNSMGEHYLHAIGMLSILHNRKVMLNGKKVSLYDALEVKPKTLEDGKVINEIVIADGAKKEDGSELTEQDLRDVKLQIQDANHRMHGAFNQTDIGDLNRNAVGRLIKQYRQWMPAFFMDRFKTKRLNVVTGKEEEGFYITAARTILGILNDAFHLKFNIATRFSNLTKEEKANLRMAGVEVGLLYLIIGMLKFMGGPDKDEPWLANAVRYNFYRLKMELGAAAPTSRDFLDNWKTLINSPVPAMENIDRVINVLDVSTMFEEIESGKYKGWNRWLRNAYFAAPYARNIGRAIDLVEGDVSMFTPYIKGRKS